MLSWKKYIKSNFLEFRRKYSQWSEKEREIVEKDTSKFFYRLNKSCQFIVVELVEPYLVSIIIINNENYPDIETTVFEKITSKDLAIIKLRDLLLAKSIDSGTSVVIEKSIESDWRLPSGWSLSYNIQKDFLKFTYSQNPRIKKSEFAEDLLQSARFEIMEFETRKQTEAIENTVGEIRENVETITENVELKEKMLASTKKLELQFAQLDDQYRELKEGLTGVRKLVGTETYGEWKVLLSEIDKMNTRVDSLSEIKNAYDKVLAQQNQFMKQQSEVMKQQSSFVTWIKYATIFVPIAVISVPIIEILLRHFLGIT